jgi:exosortase/archaeosortase family protein
VRWLDYLGLPSVSRLHASLRRAAKGEQARVAGRYLLAFSIVGLVVYLLFPDEGPPFQDGTAALVAWSASLVGLPARSVGPQVTFAGSFSFFISLGCTAYSVAIMLVAAIVAHPAPVRWRAIGTLAALPFVLVVNVARLVTLGWVGVNAPAWFDYAHVVLWQAGVILIGAAGFVLWLSLGALQSAHDMGLRALAARLGAVLAFIALFLAITWIALRVGADVLLERAVLAVAAPLAHVFWTGRVSPERLNALDRGRLLLVAMIGFGSLVLAARGVPMRDKLAGIVACVALPVVAGGIVVAFVATGLVTQGAVTPGLYTLYMVGDIGLPMLGWLVWRSRMRARYDAPRAADHA